MALSDTYRMEIVYMVEANIISMHRKQKYSEVRQNSIGLKGPITWFSNEVRTVVLNISPSN